nr:MAG TPA: hypothetical protein [Caudoviricetes sp.]
MAVDWRRRNFAYQNSKNPGQIPNTRKVKKLSRRMSPMLP